MGDHTTEGAQGPLPLVADLQARRTALGLSRAAAAGRLEVGRSTIRAWETVERQMTLARVYAYAALLGSEPVLRALPGGAGPISLAACADPETTGVDLLPIVRQLRAGRYAREWSRADLAARIWMSAHAVGVWERGDRQMLLPAVYAYAEALGCTLALEPVPAPQRGAAP